MFHPKNALRLTGLLLSALLVACVSPAPGTGGPSRAYEPPDHSFAYIRFTDSEEFCSGVLIAPRLLLTARHCLQHAGSSEPVAAGLLRVGFGDNAVVVRPDDERYVEKVLLPAGSRFGGAADLLGNDVAVAVLQLSVSSPVLTPVDLSAKTLPETLTLIGFGLDRFGSYGLRHRIAVDVTGHTDTTLTFTGGGCLGDSGGALLNHHGELVAIVSLGTTRHCIKNRLRYAQRLDAMRPFIDSALADYR